jgi:hypothetical protein
VAQVRALRERVALAEAGAGVRERELQMTIEKLRKENRTLAASAVRMSEGAFAGGSYHQVGSPPAPLFSPYLAPI